MQNRAFGFGQIPVRFIAGGLGKVGGKLEGVMANL